MNMQSWVAEDGKNFSEFVFGPAVALLRDESFLAHFLPDARDAEIVAHIQSKCIATLVFLSLAACVEMQKGAELQELVEVVKSQRIAGLLSEQDTVLFEHEVSRNASLFD